MAFPFLTAASIGVQIASAVFGASKQAKANKAAAANSRAVAAENDRIQKIRNTQIRLTAARARRRITRDRIIERARSSQDIINRGVGQGGSSFATTTGSIAAKAGQRIADVNQNLALGEEVFDANRKISNLGDRQSQLNSDARRGELISSISGTIVENFDTIQRVGTNLFAPTPTFTTTSSLTGVKF